MKLETGKYYVTRNGKLIGPMNQNKKGWWVGACFFGTWSGTEEGTYVGGRAKYDESHSYDIIGEHPCLWGSMTDAEKGALLLANHEGRKIEIFVSGHWKSCSSPKWLHNTAYRVAEPDSFLMMMNYQPGQPAFIDNQMSNPTHLLDFKEVDGELTCSITKLGM